MLGEFRTQRSVPGATILGGETMVAHVASYTALGTGARPRFDACRMKDEMDVADLESEAAHDYEVFGGTSATNLLLEDRGMSDGARSDRTLERFRIVLTPGGRLVSRLDPDEADEVELFVNDETLGRRPLENGGWQEVTWTIPPGAKTGLAVVELRGVGGAFTALHHWTCER